MLAAVLPFNLGQTQLTCGNRKTHDRKRTDYAKYRAQENSWLLKDAVCGRYDLIGMAETEVI